jgi:hypothetical protein
MPLVTADIISSNHSTMQEHENESQVWHKSIFQLQRDLIDRMLVEIDLLPPFATPACKISALRSFLPEYERP